MTMTRDFGEITYECDGDDCMTKLDVVTEDYEVAEARMHRAGWTKYDLGGQIFHYCPDCAVNL
jgi:hypothetical protein